LTDNNKAVEAEIEQVEDIETLQQVLAEEKEKAEKYLANWQRSQADFANYKQRTEQEKGEIIEFANRVLLCSLLPIIDDLERAFASVPAELNESHWTEGIRLIYNKLKATLESQGLTEIEAEGKPFDPRFHEAVMEQEGEEGMVLRETQKGYKFKERVIRPSLVIVGRRKEKRRTKQSSQKEK